MADNFQFIGPPGSPFTLPPWAPPTPPPPPAPPLLDTHQPQHLMRPPPSLSPFPPRQDGNPGFVRGFVPQQHQRHQQHQQQEHYYNVGPRFHFHSLPPSQGSFGSPPPPPFAPPPPLSAPLQMVSGMVTSTQSSDGGTSQFRGGDGARFGLYSRASPLGIARSDNLGFSKEEDEGVTAIEKGIEQTKKENKVDLKELLSQIRALVDEAEEAVQKVGKLVMLEPSTSETYLVACPYNPAHRVSPKVLFKHHLSCPSNPKPHLDAEKLISALQYPHCQKHDEDSGSDKDDQQSVELQNVLWDNRRYPNSSEGQVQVEKGNIKYHATPELEALLDSKIDIWGGRFFYRDSPAVVQTPLPTPHPATERSEKQLTVEQLGVELEGRRSIGSISVGGGSLVHREMYWDDLGPLLPSRFWLLLREIETWKVLPTRCSTLVLQSAAGVGGLRKKMVSEWVLRQGAAHGVVIDSAIASHTHSLARICLKSLQAEASTLIDHLCDSTQSIDSPLSPEKDIVRESDLAAKCGTDDQKKSLGDEAGSFTKVREESTLAVAAVRRSLKVSMIDCPNLFQSGHWLASQLSSLLGPLQSKTFVVKLLKHCLLTSGRILASPFIEAFKKQSTEGPSHFGRILPTEDGDVKPSTALQAFEEVKQIDNKPVKSTDETPSERPLPVEVESAIAALHERAILECYLRSLTYPSLGAKYQKIHEHEATVMMATAERRKRVNYRPVLEHDGLIWHRSQLEEKNKNKTREEVLAEERDYKRRRMTYRGKKLKRNPTEVLRDLIGGHMEEIVEAGGIGCLLKHQGRPAPSAEATNVGSSQRSDLSNLDDRLKPNASDVDPCPLSKSYPLNPKGMDNRGNWNGPSRGRPGRRDDRSSEQIRSRTAERDVGGTDPLFQDNRNSEIGGEGIHDDYKESKDRGVGLRGSFLRSNSYHSLYLDKDNQSFHSRSETDDGRYSRSYLGDNSADHSSKEHRKDRSRKQRYSESRDSNEDDGYDRLQSREYGRKSKNSR